MDEEMPYTQPKFIVCQKNTIQYMKYIIIKVYFSIFILLLCWVINAYPVLFKLKYWKEKTVVHEQFEFDKKHLPNFKLLERT